MWPNNVFLEPVINSHFLIQLTQDLRVPPVRGVGILIKGNQLMKFECWQRYSIVEK